MKRSDAFGANSLQCSNCNAVSKSAENLTSNNRIALMEYIGQWPSEQIENSRDVTEQLTQLGIANSINVSRSNLSKIVEPLISEGLVRKKRVHIMGADGRNVGKHMKHVYYLTAKGRQTISPRDSRRAESFSAEMWTGIYKDGSAYYGPGYPHWRDCGCSEDILELRGDWGNCFEIHCENHGYLDQICATQMRELLEQRRFATTIAGFRQLNPIRDLEAESFSAEDMDEYVNRIFQFIDSVGHSYFTSPEDQEEVTRFKNAFMNEFDEIGPALEEANDWTWDNLLGAESFSADTKRDLRKRRETPFYEMDDDKIKDDLDMNKYSRSNAGGALWQALYYACRDNGLTPKESEQFCNSKFFDHYYEYIIETLRKPLHKVAKNFAKNPDSKHSPRHLNNAESFAAHESFICPECNRASTKSKTSKVCVRCESEYQSGRNAPMRVPWPGETFESNFANSPHYDNMTGRRIIDEPDYRGSPLTPFMRDDDPLFGPTKKQRIQASLKREEKEMLDNEGWYVYDDCDSWQDDYETVIFADKNGNTMEIQWYFDISQFRDNKVSKNPKWDGGLDYNFNFSLSNPKGEVVWRDTDGKLLAQAPFTKMEKYPLDMKVERRAETFEAPNRYPVRPTRPSDDDYLPPRRPNRRPSRPGRRPGRLPR